MDIVLKDPKSVGQYAKRKQTLFNCKEALLL